MSNTHDTIIASAAKAALAPLGLTRKGRSRVWIDDHGWWLINVEFQPSSFRRGCSLNIGEQHLWLVNDTVVFERVERPIGGATFVAYDGSEEAFAHAMADVARAAADAVVRRRDVHREGVDALVRLAAGRDDLHAGIAAALLGDLERSTVRLNGSVHEAFRAQADRYVALQPADARRMAAEAVRASRTALGLPALVEPPW